MSRERAQLLAHLATERRHVLAAVDGLAEADLTRPVAPSGWSMAQLLAHLTYDDEVFWAGAIAAGDRSAIAALRDGWAAPVTTGEDAVKAYRQACERNDALLEGIDLDAPPRWWPPEEVFPFPPFEDVRACLLRLLVETATHAGHLDLVREQIDGHQHLVVG